MTQAEFRDETLKSMEAAPSLSDRRCTGCGLTVPPELNTCPNDGIAISPQPQHQIPNTYEFINVIGKGGMSVIYKARHRLMENVVAIKLLQEKLTQDKSTFLRFKQEAKASRKLDHPNVIKVHDFGVLEHGAAFLVMDYVEGTSLSEVLAKEGALSPDRAIPLFIQICEGLSHAHKNNVLHRDLKPSNVLIVKEDGRERVKIVDFGIAKVAGDGTDANKLTSTGEVFGSPLYMSPEQCMGLDVDRRADIYSMGCLMYEVLCGVPPFQGASPLEVIFKQMNESPEPIATFVRHSFAGPLSAVISRTLEKDKQHRYQNFDELIDDLYKVQRGHKVHTKRRLPHFQLAGIGAAIAALVIGYMALNPHEPWKVGQLAQRGEIFWSNGKATDADCEKLLAYKYVLRVQMRSNPNLTSAGLSKLLALPKVTEFLVDATGVDDKFLQNLAASPAKDRLVKLSIGRSHVTPAGLSALSACPQLVELDLMDQQLTDDDLEKLPSIPSLKVLKLDYNPGIHSRGVIAAFPKYPELRKICVRATNVDDAAIEALGNIAAPQQRRLLVQGWNSKITPDAASKFRGCIEINLKYVTPWWDVERRGGRLSSDAEEDEAPKIRHKKRIKLSPKQQNDA